MVKNEIHIINELPHIYELDDMVCFCNQYNKIYIYGASYNQEMLLRYFDTCTNVKNISGYCVTYKNSDISLKYRDLPIFLVENIIEEQSIGIIVGLSDRYYNNIIPLFRKYGFNSYFLMSEFNKRAISKQVSLRSQDEMTFEINLADHCNLSCQMCDHYSQLSEISFVDLESLRKDIHRLGYLYNHELACISLLGGEPLLNHKIIEIIELIREEFPYCQLIILTNGVLLLQWENMQEGNLWECCKKNNVDITVTVYPIKLDYEKIEEKAKDYGINLKMSSDIHAQNSTRVVKTSDKHVLDLNKCVDSHICVNCLYFNKFNVLKDGKIYMCPIAAHIDIFNKRFNKNLELSENDYVDIYKIDSWQEIAEFSSKYIPFCSYCDLRKWGHFGPWKPSNKDISEYI